MPLQPDDEPASMPAAAFTERIIEKRSGWRFVDFAELWDARDLILQLTPGQGFGLGPTRSPLRRAYGAGGVTEYFGQSLTNACTTGLPTA